MTPGGNISFVAVGATAGGNIISVAVYATGGGNIISVAFNATVGGNIIFVALIDTCFPVSISSAFIKWLLNCCRACTYTVLPGVLESKFYIRILSLSSLVRWFVP